MLIPEHRDLTAELATGAMSHMSLLTKQDGSSFDSAGLGTWFGEVSEQAGLPEECVLHGLRKTAARTLAEVGGTPHEIAAITGHKSLAEVERYTKAASQKQLGEAAIHRLEQNRNRTGSGKRSAEEW